MKGGFVCSLCPYSVIPGGTGTITVFCYCFRSFPGGTGTFTAYSLPFSFLHLWNGYDHGFFVTVFNPSPLERARSRHKSATLLFALPQKYNIYLKLTLSDPLGPSHVAFEYLCQFQPRSQTQIHQ